MTAPTVRLSVNLNDDTAGALAELADGHGTTLTEIVRRAIGVYAYIEQETQAGRRIQTCDQDGGNVREMVLL